MLRESAVEDHAVLHTDLSDAVARCAGRAAAHQPGARAAAQVDRAILDGDKADLHAPFRGGVDEVLAAEREVESPQHEAFGARADPERPDGDAGTRARFARDDRAALHRQRALDGVAARCDHQRVVVFERADGAPQVVARGDAPGGGSCGERQQCADASYQ